jgi:hypothetical protein
MTPRAARLELLGARPHQLMQGRSVVMIAAVLIAR